MGATMTAIYGGGPFYPDKNPNVDAIFADLRQSGFSTVIELVHIGENATIQLAPDILVQDGNYIGDPSWPGMLSALKQQPTSVDRILFCLGGAGVGDFNWIKQAYENGGLGPDSKMYESFQVLKEAIPALDGFDLDDETTYDKPSTVAFCQMLDSLGFQVTFCPYGSMPYWVDCLHALNAVDGSGPVRGFNLQCYAGGGSNSPAQWIEAIANAMGPDFPASSFVYPGLWCRHDEGCVAGLCPQQVTDRFATWKCTEGSRGLQGGFIWYYDDLQKCVRSGACGPGVPMDSRAYARAIMTGLMPPAAH